jgi:leader peptidase (prepilin peptidase)/N-methyltransferase
MPALPPAWIIALLGAIFGAIIGSFIATLVMRWPAGRSVSAGRSACDGCGRTLSAIDLIPLLSFLAVRGRARCCGARIAPLHPVTEVLAAAIGAVAFAMASWPEALAGAAFGWMLLTLALLDWRHFWLPERLTIALALAGLAVGWLGIGPVLQERLIGGVAGFLSFEIVRRLYRLLRHRDGMGGGDVRLFGAIGLWLGWRPLPVVLLVASVTGLIWAGLLLLRRRGQPVGKVPFGAFLAFAGGIMWLVEQAGGPVV